MRAIEIAQPGGPEVLREAQRPDPVAKPGELLIAVQASGINRPDVLQRKGLYPMPPGVSDLPGLEVAGTVRAIAPTADPQTRNVLVFADLPKHAELKAGTFAHGQFQIGASQALTVPAQSIVVRDGHNYVFVIGADNKAGQRKIDTGRRVGDRVEVLQGLKADEAVAVQGAGFLNEGDLVKLVQ